MATKCYSLVRGRRMRVTRLDDCGRFVFGADSHAVSKGFVSVALTAETTETDEISTTDADGEVIVMEPSEENLAGYSAVITFRQVDPELFNIITGQRVYVDYNGDIVGFAVNTKVKAKRFGLELWAGVHGGDACENPEAQGNYGYMLYPNMRGGIVGDLSVENGGINFTISGARSLDGAYWGRGVYPVMLNATNLASLLPTALDKDDHFLNIVTQLAPPEPVCGARPVLDPTEEALTSISAGVVGSTATFTPTPDDIAAPAYYEYGDGTFDYIPAEDLGEAVHVYEAPGTYTVRATTNNSTVTTTVTIAA